MRYGCVGLSLALLYSLTVIACVRFVDPTAASVIAFFVTLPIGYLAHNSISFYDSRNDAFQPLRFAVTTAASFVISVGGMYWITEVAGRSYLLGIAWNWLTIPAINFLIYLFWVFQVAGKRERAT
jgi:putative flippase GtrA